MSAKEIQPGYFVGSQQVNQLRSIGEVYEGYIINENKEKQDCLVKVIRISEEGENVEREIEVLNNTQHPNIVKTLQVIRIGRIVYLFKDCDSQIMTLESICQQLKLRQQNASIQDDQLLSIAAYLIDCLFFMDQKNITNRDIRPGNIIVNRGTLHPKIFDFGSAKLMEGDEIEQTLDLGQQEYQSPQMIGTDEVEYVDYAKCDVWSLGMTLYYLGEKNYPWGRKIQSHEIDTVLMQMKQGVKFSLIQNKDLQNLISRMLIYSQDDRPNTQQLLAEFPQLQKVLESLNPLHAKLQFLSGLIEKITNAFQKKQFNSEILEIMLNHILRFFTPNKQDMVEGTIVHNAYQSLLLYQINYNKTLLLKRQLDIKTAEILQKYHSLIEENKPLNDDEKTQISLFINCLDLDKIEDDKSLQYIKVLKQKIA